MEFAVCSFNKLNAAILLYARYPFPSSHIGGISEHAEGMKGTASDGPWWKNDH